MVFVIPLSLMQRPDKSGPCLVQFIPVRSLLPRRQTEVLLNWVLLCFLFTLKCRVAFQTVVSESVGSFGFSFSTKRMEIHMVVQANEVKQLFKIKMLKVSKLSSGSHSSLQYSLFFFFEKNGSKFLFLCSHVESLRFPFRARRCFQCTDGLLLSVMVCLDAHLKPDTWFYPCVTHIADHLVFLWFYFSWQSS